MKDNIKDKIAVHGRCSICGALPGERCDPAKGNYWGTSQEDAGAHLTRLYDNPYTHESDGDGQL